MSDSEKTDDLRNMIGKSNGVLILLLTIIFYAWNTVEVNGSEIIFEDGRSRPRPADREVRIRKEFTAMSFQERIRFIEAYKFVSTAEHFRRRYEHLVRLHQTLFRKVHVEKQFFPWHRWYLLKFENLLRQADPRVTLPYWDWSLKSQKLWENNIGDVWSNHPWGLGGNGSYPYGCVESGPFNKHVWRLTDKSGGGCLRRNFMGRMPSIVSVHATLRWTPQHFQLFERKIRAFYHNELHCCIQGTMELPSASNSPEFLLHHTFMDKIWYDWQNKGPDYKFKLDDNMESPLRGSQYVVGQFMDSSDLVNGISIYYDDPIPGYQQLHATLSRIPLAVLETLDSYNSKTAGKACCPKSLKAIEEKKNEIQESKENMSEEVARDYGDLDFDYEEFV